VTKEELTAAIAACAKKKGHTPSRAEVLKDAGVTRRLIRKHFGSYQYALEACGLQGFGGGKKVQMEQLFQDWAGVVRKVKKVPSLTEYEQKSKYSIRPLLRVFGAWSNVADGMKLYAIDRGLADEYKDVLDVIEQRATRQSDVPRVSVPTCGPKILKDRPMYGLRIQDSPLVFAPVNEQGVVYLFGALSERLGFLVLRVQTEFPDCEAMRVVDGKRMQRVRIEFEYESRNFLRHMHEPAGCDLIVCWEHNWPECPLEVVELKGEIGRSPTSHAIGRPGPFTTEDTKEHKGN
jgi:Homing endonuclease associated repeat